MRIGVSACLLGNMCRYDGAHAKDDFVVNQLQNYFEMVPYCPEAIVFGTPRDTIRLVEFEHQIKVLTNKEQNDVTQVLSDISQSCASQIADENLCGFILKSKSPTCGLERVKVYEPNSHMCEKKGEGLFAKSIKEKYPYLPLEEEGRLQDDWLKENFLMQVFAYKDVHEFLATSPSFNELVKFHTSYKYLIYAKSHEAYKSMGNIVANHEKKSLEEVLTLYKEHFLKAISMKGSIKNTYNVLLHIYGYFKKVISKDEKEEMLKAIDEYKMQIIPLIAVIKIINLYTQRFDMEYLKTQKFLKPYPSELALRSSLKANK
ncbi:YbgA family protein [Candidatus Marinarcus aquaticus]|uniref:DUF1722 domain-containing protein n=1 Tax=Candidatus Marinarcus aquaticus TaxID=2044504 RepID=A0A4Q0XNX2_9BACT|nr:DUF523 and DUF1722 domain-containing protein [Candidatus Marinarcus aquaticus]RXJ54453.1 hypothetical protein CRV04_11720 [Candidatus Marinarcus aquaticus]